MSFIRFSHSNFPLRLADSREVDSLESFVAVCTGESPKTAAVPQDASGKEGTLSEGVADMVGRC